MTSLNDSFRKISTHDNSLSNGSSTKSASSRSASSQNTIPLQEAINGNISVRERKSGDLLGGWDPLITLFSIANEQVMDEDCTFIKGGAGKA